MTRAGKDQLCHCGRPLKISHRPCARCFYQSVVRQLVAAWGKAPAKPKTSSAYLISPEARAKVLKLYEARRIGEAQAIILEELERRERQVEK